MGLKMIIAYSFGMIDFLHYGHIQALMQAKQNSDFHVFGLVADQAMETWLGMKVSDYEEREGVLKQIRLIDDIMPQKNFDPTDNLKMLHKKYPNAKIVLYHGDDWKIVPAKEYLNSIKGEVVFTKYYDKLSPEKIVNKLTASKREAQKRSNLISTKANTLLSLKPLLKKGRIEDIFIVTYGTYVKKKHEIVRKIMEQFQGVKIVVRSSSVNEDSYEKSNAGHFDSILNVDSFDGEEIINAIDKVYKSYVSENLLEISENEQVLIQTMTKDAVCSGVIFTRDINENRPYYLINYDVAGITDAVTSGKGGETLWISRNIKTEDVDKEWRNLLAAVREIENILNNMVLDIEFAIDANDIVTIFQVRPLAANYRFKRRFHDNEFYETLSDVRENYRMFASEKEGMTSLSDMAFWNPSEIIGTNPHALDYSLYREIITKRAWSEGIAQLGYRFVPKDLMCRIGNKPYISLERSFEGLIPKTINVDLGNKLKNYYLRKAKHNPAAHDKIEFDIIYTCFDYSFEEIKTELGENSFSDAEIVQYMEALKLLTENAIKSYEETLQKDLLDLNILEENTDRIQQKIVFKETDVFALLRCFKELIMGLKQYGTPQFSRQARCAFISRAHCKSLVKKGYFLENQMEEFLLSIHTVASEFEADYTSFQTGELSRDKFNKKYGHLRAGTYDIRTLRYDELEFKINDTTALKNDINKIKKEHKQNEMKLDIAILKKALDDIGFDIDVQKYYDFLKTSIEMREYFKFVFTKTLSLALKSLVLAGECIGISRNELSYIEMADILSAEYYDTEYELKQYWETLILQRKKKYKQYEQLILPELIWEEKNISVIHFSESKASYITSSLVESDVAVLDSDDNTMSGNIGGKIVLIEKADPGYDWIFSQNIKGLITKYGGAASHMAIRCAEFGIPAAIGCGEKKYSSLQHAKALCLDCKKGEIKII